MVTMACGLQVDLPEMPNIPDINIPVDEIQVGPPQTEIISIPAPSGEDIRLDIGFGVGDLTLTPGAGGNLVEGTATYNIADFKPIITVEGGHVQLKAGELKIEGFPKLSGAKIKNDWVLQLGSLPMDLSIQAGAYKGELELGSLPLKSLEIGDGAADMELTFSAPNPIEMTNFRYNTGASNVRLSGLANANFSAMTFRSGAGDYRLDFSGLLQRDATVNIESGISQVVVVVPAGLNARVKVSSQLTSVNARGVWEQSGEDYFLNGSGPTLTIYITMGAGSLGDRKSVV